MGNVKWEERGGRKLGDKKVYGLADNMVLLAKDEGARGVERLEEYIERNELKLNRKKLK